MSDLPASTPSVSPERVIADTRNWLERAVIGLNLCPFAKAVHVKNQIRFVVSATEDVQTLHAELVEELRHLNEADPAQIDTTLLIHPRVLTDFLDFNDFLGVAEDTVARLGLEGCIQVASFHPDFQFAGTAPDDITNYTNRAPYPILHLLREDSVERAVQAYPDAADIFEKNMETLERLGLAGWKRVTGSDKEDN